MNYPFNVRVYGLLIDEHQRVLLSDEEEYGFRFSKFPGGGLEYGEGLIEALIREFKEECQVEVEVLGHFYTTDFFIKSVFNESQVISVYYFVKAKEELNLNFKTQMYDFDGEGDIRQAFRWKAVSDLAVNELTFETDRKVAQLLLENKF
ncbi:MAG: NUDIX domain-containing protein [Sphingobacteriaceae bacterium]